MRRETQNVLLVLLGGALLKISLTDVYLRYVKAAHQWLLITAGVAMLALAAVAIVRDMLAARRAAAGADDEEQPDVAPGHHHSSRGAWLLLLPVLAVFLIAPPPLGADSAAGADSRNAPPPAAEEDGTALFPALPPGKPALTLMDFAARAAWDRAKSLEDREVRLTGFVLHEGGASYLARFAIACCAADSYPVKVKLNGDAVTGIPNDTWLHATVVLVPGSATKDNNYIPTVDVVSLRKIPQPRDPYEH